VRVYCYKNFDLQYLFFVFQQVYANAPIMRICVDLVGNTTTPFLHCISMLWVAIESCYCHRTRNTCIWTGILQHLIWVANISLRDCNRLVLMHLLFRIVLHLVRNTNTQFLCCTRNLHVAIESSYGHHTRVGCVWTTISQRLIWVGNISLHCCNTRGYCFVSSLKEEYRIRISTKFVLMKKIYYRAVAKFKMRFNI
jgi:hypothetical protein